MRHFSRLFPFLLASLVASCATPPKPAPAPVRAPPIAAPMPAPQDWRDLAETKGSWRYVATAGSTAARFEAVGAVLFTIRCDATMHRISLARTDAAGAALIITTSYGSRTPATSDLPASDPLFDQIAFSRGRFTIETTAHPELVLPAWAEPARVIEDCRG